MKFDFSHFVTTETTPICKDEKVIFEVIAQEIPHGEYVKLQQSIMGNLKMGKKKDIERQIDKIELDATAFSDGRILLGIQSWTLKNADGSDVAVSMESWHALPHYMTEQIEKAVDRLNPNLDDEFQN